MNTEITDNNAATSAGWIFFDADCRFCLAGRRRWGRVFERRGFNWLPLQTPGIAARLGVTHEQLLAEMWVLPAGGRPISGIGAWIELMRQVWWLWPLAELLRLPGVHDFGQAIYRWVARNRYCIAGRCKVPRPGRTGLRVTDCLLLVSVVGGILAFGWSWSGWIFMWTLAIALGQLGKWLMWRDAHEAGPAATARWKLVWFFLWPGLDGRAFFKRSEKVPLPHAREWLAASVKLALGFGCVWLVAPTLLPEYAIVAGWVAMIGVVLCLHFGFFHLLSLTWRAVGINAQPIMNRPLSATSLAEFWGERWNTAFSIPARRLLFNPLARRSGIVVANLVVFLASGALHELVISLPARAGYGLPTVYFVLQGVGVLFERSNLGRKLGLGRGWRGRLFTFVITTAPAYWLFHPPFVRNVILPMLQAMGVTGITP